MSLLRRRLNWGASLCRHHEELTHAVSKAVEAYFPPVECSCRCQTRLFPVRQLLDIPARKRHPINLLSSAPVGVEYQPALIGRDVEPFDFLAAGGHLSGSAQTHRPGAGNRNRPD